MIIEAGLTACRLLHYASTLVLFGMAIYPLYAGEDGAPIARLTRNILVAAAGLGLLSGIGWFAFTTASMAGALASALDPQAVGLVLTQTDFGPLWVARLATLVALLAVAFANPRSTALRGLFLGLAALALASLAGAGHAKATQGAAGTLHLAADGVHLLAAGAWLGGLVPLGLAVGRWIKVPDALAQRTLQRFSGMGSLAVAGLVATGLINSWFLVGSIPALWSSAYGLLLTAKLVVFLAMVALAALNRFWLTPLITGLTIQAQTGLKVLRRHIIAEQILGLIVVGLVSILGQLQPPN